MMLVYLIGLVVAVALSGFFAGSETGLYCVNRLRMKVDAEHGDHAAARIAPLIDRPQDTLTILLVGTTIVQYFATVCATHVVTAWLALPSGKGELYTTALLTPVLFVFGEVVPKIIFQRSADRLMRLGSLMLASFAALLRWPAAALNAVAEPVVRWFDPAGVSDASDPRRRMTLLLQDAIATDDESGEHSELVQRVLGLSAVALHQVMVPRNRVITIHADADRRELLAVMRRHPHTRFPIHDRNPRRIIGYVVAHELLADEGWSTVMDRLQSIVTLPANESVAAAILRLQAERETLAVVADRHGSMLGLVTRKDLFEELTGELHAW
jgi:putative hemolysin